jgi:hypothetical protein
MLPYDLDDLKEDFDRFEDGKETIIISIESDTKNGTIKILTRKGEYDFNSFAACPAGFNRKQLLAHRTCTVLRVMNK